MLCNLANDAVLGPRISDMVQDTMVLWSKSSTLDRKVKGSSFEVDDLDARRKKEDGNENRRARERPLTSKRAQNRTRS